MNHKQIIQIFLYITTILTLNIIPINSQSLYQPIYVTTNENFNSSCTYYPNDSLCGITEECPCLSLLDAINYANNLYSADLTLTILYLLPGQYFGVNNTNLDINFPLTIQFVFFLFLLSFFCFLLFIIFQLFVLFCY